jgi:hypothetical protein
MNFTKNIDLSGASAMDPTAEFKAKLDEQKQIAQNKLDEAKATLEAEFKQKLDEAKQKADEAKQLAENQLNEAKAAASKTFNEVKSGIISVAETQSEKVSSLISEQMTDILDIVMDFVQKEVLTGIDASNINFFHKGTFKKTFSGMMPGIKDNVLSILTTGEMKATKKTNSSLLGGLCASDSSSDTKQCKDTSGINAKFSGFKNSITEVITDIPSEIPILGIEKKERVEETKEETEVETKEETTETEVETTEVEITLSTPRSESDDGCNDTNNITNQENEINTPSPSVKPQMDETTLKRLISSLRSYAWNSDISLFKVVSSI